MRMYKFKFYKNLFNYSLSKISSDIGYKQQFEMSIRMIDIYNCCIYNGNMKTVINIKTDKEIKEKAQELARELGVPLSTLVNAYLRQFIRTREFSFSLAYSMSPELEKIIVEVEKDIINDKNLSPRFDSAGKAISFLDKK